MWQCTNLSRCPIAGLPCWSAAAHIKEIGMTRLKTLFAMLIVGASFDTVAADWNMVSSSAEEQVFVDSQSYRTKPRRLTQQTEFSAWSLQSPLCEPPLTNGEGQRSGTETNWCIATFSPYDGKRKDIKKHWCYAINTGNAAMILKQEQRLSEISLPPRAGQGYAGFGNGHMRAAPALRELFTCEITG